jgi:hypothetical protein
MTKQNRRNSVWRYLAASIMGISFTQEPRAEHECFETLSLLTTVVLIENKGFAGFGQKN